MKTVLIVAEGSWGRMKEGDKGYKEEIQYYTTFLEAAKSPRLGGGEEKAATVKVVPTAEVAEEMIKSGGVDAVVFISRGMEVVAEQFAGAYPETRIVVFTGLIPKGKVIWVNKIWDTATTHKGVQDVVLR